MPKVLVNPPVLYHAQGSFRRALESAGCEIVFPAQLPISPAELKQRAGEVDAALASVEKYSRDILAGSKLRVIARMGVGYDAVDVAAATELGIAVCTTPGTNE